MKIIKINSKSDNLELEVAIIKPQTTPKGIVQLTHGMTEHKERYFDFMKFLSTNGYICIIHDHRGHGASVKDSNHLGYFYTEDINYIVDDLHQVTEYIKKEYPKLELYLFSHSMGTLVARNYLKKYDNNITKLILCGPPTKNSLAKLAVPLAKSLKIFYPNYKPNKLLGAISINTYNKGYKKKNAWICSDETVVDNYNKNDLCNFQFSTNGYINLLKLLKESFNTKNWDVKNPGLPIYLIAGENDQVIQSKQKFLDLEHFLNNLGYKNTTTKLYEEKRHELLNETNKAQVYQDILDFIAK